MIFIDSYEHFGYSFVKRSQELLNRYYTQDNPYEVTFLVNIAIGLLTVIGERCNDDCKASCKNPCYKHNMFAQEKQPFFVREVELKLTENLFNVFCNTITYCLVDQYFAFGGDIPTLWNIRNAFAHSQITMISLPEIATIDLRYDYGRENCSTTAKNLYEFCNGLAAAYIACFEEVTPP